MLIELCDSLLIASSVKTNILEWAIYDHKEAVILKRLVCADGNRMDVSIIFTDASIMYPCEKDILVKDIILRFKFKTMR